MLPRMAYSLVRQTYVLSEGIAHGSIRFCDCLPMDVEGCICCCGKLCGFGPDRERKLVLVLRVPGSGRAHTAGLGNLLFYKLGRDSRSGSFIRARRGVVRSAVWFGGVVGGWSRYGGEGSGIGTRRAEGNRR